MNRRSMFDTGAICATVIATATAAAPVLAATPGTQIVAVTGDPAPDGNGSFVSRFVSPALNDAGEVAFTGFLTGTSGGSSDDTGIFRGDGTTLTQIARAGDTAPDGNGSFGAFSDLLLPALNGAGQVAFYSSLVGTSGGFRDREGIFRGDGTPGGLIQIARGGDVAPDGNGSLLSPGLPALNGTGQVAFTDILIDTSGGSSDDTGIFRGDGTTLTQVARKGDATPDGNGSFSHVGGSAKLNGAGQVAFVGAIDLGDGGSVQDDWGIFRGDGTPGSLIRIAREGDTAPDANGSFSFFRDPALNDAGQVAFNASLIGTSGGLGDDDGMFRGNGTPGGLIQIAREGDAAPDANGSFSSFDRPALNDAGQAAFIAFLSGTSGGISDNMGIFLGDGATAPMQIAREGQAAPDANGSFSSFAHPALNDAGQAAFFAALIDTSGGSADDSGIFYFDSTLGLIQVAREGDDLLGGTITGLGFIDGSHSDFGDPGRTGLNALGQVAFTFSLHDGREGIAIWTVPETTSLALLGLGGLSLLRRKRVAPSDPRAACRPSGLRA